MNNKRFMGILSIALLSLTQVVHAQASVFRFLATGDMPYSPEQDTQYRRLLKQSESEDFDFLMHVGDFKAASAPCSDDAFRRIRDLFRTYPKPVVYTPGDNEWTDCRSFGVDPVERLDKLRDLFFKDPQTLRLEQMNVQFQSLDPRHATYVENYRFSRSGVLFIVVHVVGSGNNYGADNTTKMREFKGRNAANLAFMKESFAAAIASDAAGTAVIIHANPDFENGKKQGFRDFLAAMRGFLSSYHKPVVCIHGDTHYFRIDKPFKNAAGQTYLNFTRMEVFGASNVAGVVVSVDPEDPQVFSYRPYYLKGK